ncbi:MAG: DUF5050 domain-containing protein [Oscillospiraceae bacterium]|jgi:hypothetical protein|nr:DUF5050 domain-containing protein [Oscillospiraceae bacterium]
MKRFACVFLALMMLALFAACGRETSAQSAVLPVEDSIFFAFGGALYREDPAKSTRARVLSSGVSGLILHGGWFYFVDTDQDNHLSRVRTDGTGREIFVELAAAQPQPAGDWIYFINRDDRGRLYRARGGEEPGAPERVTKRVCTALYAEDNVLFYSDGKQIFRLPPDAAEDGATPLPFQSSGVKQMQLAGGNAIAVRGGRLSAFRLTDETFLLDPVLPGEAEDWLLTAQGIFYSQEGQLLRLSPDIFSVASKDEVVYEADPNDPNSLLAYANGSRTPTYRVAVPAGGGDPWYVTVRGDSVFCAAKSDDHVFKEFLATEIDVLKNRSGTIVLPLGCRRVVGVAGEHVYFIAEEDGSLQRTKLINPKAELVLEAK